MKTDAAIQNLGMTRQPRKLPLVLTLTLALLISLAHCATCDLSFAGNEAAVATAIDDNTSPPASEKHLAACSGHCLSHVTTLTIAAAVLPANIVHEAPPTGREQSSRSIAGLPLFKPPRA